MALEEFIRKLRSKPARLFTRRNRDILAELVRAYFKIIDHNSILGVLWSLINPLVMLVVMYAIFSTRFGNYIPYYPLYILIGIIPVNFFIAATSNNTAAFFNHRNTILNTSVPREDILASNLCVHFYKFLIELAICVLVSLSYGLLRPLSFLALIPLIAAFAGLIMGISFILAVLYCFARDTEHLWTIGARLLLFVTPIFYKLQFLSPWAAKLVYWCNPVTPFVLAFRGAFMGGLDIGNYVYSLFLGAVFFVLGYSFFIVFENVSVERA
jgi:ABC-type polysaccharide/polyol phosphate export permease